MGRYIIKEMGGGVSETKDSMFISVEDRTREIGFSYNYSMSFAYS